ncbi:MAG TPA: hypothetical protein PLK67_02610, partial [Bryobacteraceae bacterium]|nr:hypothetical protein [Bryobacteraceae bacterium]
MRTASVERNTKETRIRGKLRIEGRGRYQISTGIRFLDHMLELFAKHGGFDLELEAAGDLDVDQHHTVEDVGIVLGQLFCRALGDRRGINRAGYFVMPMDETLAVAAVIWWLVPDKPVAEKATSLADQFSGVKQVFFSRHFWRYGPLAFW